MNKPQLGWTTEAQIERVVDGDTIELSIKRKFKVRLNNLSTPEKNCEAGKQAKSFLVSYLRSKTDDFKNPVTLFIPANNPITLIDFNSFERIVGDIWVDSSNVSDIIKQNGHGVDYNKQKGT